MYKILSTSTQANKPCSHLVRLRLKLRDNYSELLSPTPHHDAIVRPKERVATILAQVDFAIVAYLIQTMSLLLDKRPHNLNSIF